MKYYIFRHGETYFSKNKIAYGEYEETAEILPEAKEAIKKIGEYLKDKKIDAFYSSPVLRCRQTVEIVSREINEEFLFDERIKEYGYESYKEFVERLRDFLEFLKKKEYQSVAICTHGYPIAVLRALITKGKFSLPVLPRYPKTGTLLEIDENKKENLIDFNN